MSAVSDVVLEMARQVALWGVQKHRDFYSRTIHPRAYLSLRSPVMRRIVDGRERDGDQSWDGILAEEFAEVLDCYDDPDSSHLREELIQVAAVALSWAEAIDRRA